MTLWSPPSRSMLLLINLLEVFGLFAVIVLIRLKNKVNIKVQKVVQNWEEDYCGHSTFKKGYLHKL